MSKGIYQYVDVNNGDVVYIGRDSNIHRNQRHNAHLNPSRYDDQPFNRVLQNNPERYEYSKICEHDSLSDEELDYLEIKENLKHIFLHGTLPRHSYTIGGSGSIGFHHTIKSRKRISDSHKGIVPWNKGISGYHNNLTDEYRKELSDKWKGENNPNANGLSAEQREHLRKLNTKDYARIVLGPFTPAGKRQYKLKGSDSKELKRSIDIDKLIKWFTENYPDEELIIHESIEYQ